ncbi:hydantoinase B/oxoprolinase family protein [Spirulina subsalsa]|uniref:hydantoinase B/oxoprolinase family protein n=1 Tax=Spirulina subsalsa TaxID=54311 RepID=UPI000310D92B
MTPVNSPQNLWQFWIDRGGTFTDIVAKRPDGEIVIHKLLSENPEQYPDAPLQGIRDIMGVSRDQPIPTAEIESLKMGTTVATNALLEHKGDRVVLVVTQGFKDALRIGYQNRPQIFAREIILPRLLYETVIEAVERIDARGTILTPLQIEAVRQDLEIAHHAGIRSCAIVLMHGYRYPEHEQAIAQLAQEIGFTQISVSHQVSPLMKWVSRGNTTVVDAYLSPILRRYVDQVATFLWGEKNPPTPTTPHLLFMQSNGGLTAAHRFQGKDSILSGPAGGIVGAVKTSAIAGYQKIIGFDMGGTSTDVSHYAGEYERSLETEIAGVRLQTPMMAIHTVAAGGGSMIHYDSTRYLVGPQSAGAHPGPAAYGKGGPLTITDCNVRVGKLQPAFFPPIFGLHGDQPLNTAIVWEKFDQLTAAIDDGRTPEQVASGFLAIAVEKMANAIKKISLQRGYDVTQYTLCCFGGAGGQHACLIADALGMEQILIHPYAGVLSAYGIGLADIRILREKALELPLNPALEPQLSQAFQDLSQTTQAELRQQYPTPPPISQEICTLHLKYQGTDSTLPIHWDNYATMQAEFATLHHQRYGFTLPDKPLIVQSLSLELVCPTQIPPEKTHPRTTPHPPQPLTTVPLYTADQWHQAPVYQREDLQPGDIIPSPALIIESTGTNVLEPGWQAEVNPYQHLILRKVATPAPSPSAIPSADQADPVLLEIFNNLFRSIAEQMGTTLQNTSYSVNIKERLDFSCAIFDQQGQLVANAPHIPVHLGSMGESVTRLIENQQTPFKPGDVYALNNPYNGGTHLPDITVITPVFNPPDLTTKPLFYVASRGHHADIGGITPGSMPPQSQQVQEEGILIDNFQLVDQGTFREPELIELLTTRPYPVRNLTQNIADLQAQIAANEKGVQELQKMVQQYGLETVQAYMRYVQENAELCVRRVINVLKDGEFSTELDSGEKIQVKITIHRDETNLNNNRAVLDFTGTSAQTNSNYNAPSAICKAAVLYVFRSLIDQDIPLNAGCLNPLEIIIPPGCLLNPQFPAAVVAGNVETSQLITDCLYGALGIMAAAQGTMNNFTFGNEKYQYYETICGGSGAGATFNGTDAVQTHMTNSRLTDPEVLEWRFPVLLKSFTIRPQSGGDGLFKGGNGVIRQIQVLEPMTAAILSSRRRVAPFGLAGGEAGLPGKNYVLRQGETLEKLGNTAMVELEAGDCFVIETPGGGGFGSLKKTYP